MSNTNVKFCLVRRKDSDKFLGKEYEEGYFYSEYTNSDASFGDVWCQLDHFMNEDNLCVSIFESSDKANIYLKRNTFDYNPEEYEIINMEDAWSLADKVLLEDE